MSVLLEYQSHQAVTPEVSAQIATEQRQLLKERCYWSEPLYIQQEQTAKLVGGNSLFNSGGYETQSGEWMEVSQNEDYLMAWSDTDFIVHKLAAWSKAHGMDWSIYSAGDHVGDVVRGEPSKNLQEFLEGLLEMSTFSPGMVPEIDHKFKNRCEPLQPATSANVTANAAANQPKTERPWWRFW
ncbi:hypothetical protein [Luteimonas sp. A649]